ncbi:hypothetical protein J6590_029831 [Homalodisca vitripennis]|nr:hypothetical protein J6590_029831 [Homalodisca vitripennis]
MTASNRHMHDALNHELQREQQYDAEALAKTDSTSSLRFKCLQPHCQHRTSQNSQSITEKVNSNAHLVAKPRHSWDRAELQIVAVGILAAKNKDVDDLSVAIQNFLPGHFVSFISVNTVINQDDVVNYPTKFLN